MRTKAIVYTNKDHCIKKSDIDPDAFRVTERLRRSGYSAFIVGGAVRDLLLGKHPKDFDVVTDAVPRVIKKLFRNSRIIGKRFRLVHVFFGPKIIEVATFRSLDPESSLFGTLEEDVLRRDFRINALYYSPYDETVIDYIGGMKDIRSRKLHALIPLKSIFTEDPVRMVRAIKYSATTGFRISWFLSRAIRKNSPRLADVSPSRITEELFKILGSGASADIFRLARKYDLLPHILPTLDSTLNDHRSDDFEERFLTRMQQLDDRMKQFGDIKKGRMLSFLLQDYLNDKGLLNGDAFSRNGKMQEHAEKTYREIKLFLKPLVPPNAEVENAVRFLLESDRKSSFRKRQRVRKKPQVQKDAHPHQHPAQHQGTPATTAHDEQGGAPTSHGTPV